MKSFTIISHFCIFNRKWDLQKHHEHNEKFLWQLESQSALLCGETTKTSETAKFIYKHSINLLNALLRSRHHSRRWHFIFKLREKTRQICFLHFTFLPSIWNDEYFPSSGAEHEMYEQIIRRMTKKSQNTLTNSRDFFPVVFFFIGFFSFVNFLEDSWNVWGIERNFCIVKRVSCFVYGYT